MFAIAFDLDTAETEKQHPKSLTQAYADIRSLLESFGFEWKQGSVYTSENENLGDIFDTMEALRAMPWFPPSVRDIRAFRVEQWSDFTHIIKRDPTTPAPFPKKPRRIR